MINKSRKVVKTFLLVNVLVILLGITPMSFSEMNEMHKSEEWWIQMEIFPVNNNQDYSDKLLVDLYENVIQLEREYILSWHFIREPSLRFRIELINEENRDRIADDLYNYLSSVSNIDTYYFANHSEKVENLDEGYNGEYKLYQRMWPYQKKIWEWGSEMTVEAIKEQEVTGKNFPSREFQLTRTFHLLSLQLSPRFDIWYCFRLDNDGGILVWFIIVVSFILGFKCNDFWNHIRGYKRHI